MQRNHRWLVVISEGEAIHVPSETVRTCPLARVPETSGLTEAVGIAVITWLDLEKLEVAPRPFNAVTLTSKCLPTRSAGIERI